MDGRGISRVASSAYFLLLLIPICGAFPSAVDAMNFYKPLFYQRRYLTTLNEYSSRSLPAGYSSFILDVINKGCNTPVPLSLSSNINITMMANNTQCVVAENRFNGSKFLNGWPVVMINQYVNNSIYLHVPHPLFDTDTEIQGAIFFQNVPFKALLISSRHRHAYEVDSSCQPGYSVSDAAHSNVEPIHILGVELVKYHKNRNDPNYLVIQLHRMNDDTCLDDIFISTGILNNATQQANPTWPIHTLRSLVRSNMPNSVVVGTPMDSSCSLTATDNILGRYINGRLESEVCNRTTLLSRVRGQFIHIEQGSPSFENMNVWITILNTLVLMIAPNSVASTASSTATQIDSSSVHISSLPTTSSIASHTTTSSKTPLTTFTATASITKTSTTASSVTEFTITPSSKVLSSSSTTVSPMSVYTSVISMLNPLSTFVLGDRNAC
jgi:hypothetical protein